MQWLQASHHLFLSVSLFKSRGVFSRSRISLLRLIGQNWVICPPTAAKRRGFHVGYPWVGVGSPSLSTWLFFGAKRWKREMGSTAVSCSCVLAIYCYVKAQKLRDENNTSFALDSGTCMRFGWNSSFLLHLADICGGGLKAAFRLTHSQHPAVNARGPFLAAGGFSLCRTEKRAEFQGQMSQQPGKSHITFYAPFRLLSLQWKQVTKVRPCKWNSILFCDGRRSKEYCTSYCVLSD